MDRLPAFARCVLAAAATLAASAQEAAAEPPAAWTGSAAVSWYALPDEDDFLLPVLIAEHDRLHLEARYNYEDRDTASLFAGWAFSTGTTVELGATPMLGAVFGATDGIALGCTVTASWRRIALYSENEYVTVPADHDDDFLYDWSELTYEPVPWLRAGLVSQRTRAYRTDRELQRGVLVGVAVRRWSLAGSWFEPGDDDQIGVVTLGFEL
jgi:hypothetical protein